MKSLLFAPNRKTGGFPLGRYWTPTRVHLELSCLFLAFGDGWTGLWWRGQYLVFIRRRRRLMIKRHRVARAGLGASYISRLERAATCCLLSESASFLKTKRRRALAEWPQWDHCSSDLIPFDPMNRLRAAYLNRDALTVEQMRTRVPSPSSSSSSSWSSSCPLLCRDPSGPLTAPPTVVAQMRSSPAKGVGCCLVVAAAADCSAQRQSSAFDSLTLLRSSRSARCRVGGGCLASAEAGKVAVTQSL